MPCLSLRGLGLLWPSSFPIIGKDMPPLTSSEAKV
jgi:hypothetical protein